MNESNIANELHAWWRNEVQFLPISIGLALSVSFVVWFWRLDQVDHPFFLGILVGALLAGALHGCVLLISLGALLRGAPRQASLIVKLRWLVRAK